MRLSLDLSLGSLVATAGSGGYTFLNAEAADLVARFTTPAADARKALIDDLVGSLKTAGVWAKLDALYMFAAANSQAALLNWVQDLYNATAVSSPTFTADRGFSGNASSSYVDSGFNPSTAVGANFLQNSAFFGAWSRTAGTQGGSAAGYFDGTKGVTLQPRDASNNTVGRINQASSSAALATTPDGSGLFGLARSASNALRLARNGVSLAALTTASSALANGTLRFGNFGTAVFSGIQFAAGLIGGNLTVAEELDAFNAINSYMTAVGAA